MNEPTSQLEPSFPDRDLEIDNLLRECLARDPFEADPKALAEGIRYLLDKWIKLSIDVGLVRQELNAMKSAGKKKKARRRKRE